MKYLLVLFMIQNGVQTPVPLDDRIVHYAEQKVCNAAGFMIKEDMDAPGATYAWRCDPEF